MVQTLSFFSGQPSILLSHPRCCHPSLTSMAFESSFAVVRQYHADCNAYTKLPTNPRLLHQAHTIQAASLETTSSTPGAAAVTPTSSRYVRHRFFFSSLDIDPPQPEFPFGSSPYVLNGDLIGINFVTGFSETLYSTPMTPRMASARALTTVSIACVPLDATT